MLDTDPDAIPLLRPDGRLRTLKEIEDAAIDHALLKCRSLSQVARQLGIGRGTVYRKMRSLYQSDSQIESVAAE